ncbi:2-succinyl-5-enolpyruvyl-6-hydroxy-3-cyclohexene-1-carboxylic-acid synthase [Corynebacterium pseudotuberculosis]|uniref:2-succinyl-5-enolpyruvyl-6-hydroxy-3- cyclohexene-1-carboxylic-acid synthase n=1 Tax=Corynebacterium pseudotuberculosis TaxID=1719 RepID=UPI0002660383|nr:2-succinyl-5-enolpyruvyl-6-hydroxy-3-cyclohexene-1-carboxylic-acid synthase [Corynebacterium pseudotuberculosis]AFM06666.1 2-succinyl-5-enolpyruvyl-6-hydroxy-3-cyclohexene-1-carboxylic-acid synthase [Corynebacterium pseudotuberculosis Cp162]APG81021.1 2-oxoglutarate decarboxylase/2-succinyl-6-hydroxy-2, 4-cyclohexadiene-1-carboxylate synthase [Corynebacterium pseudotuberculosis]WFP67494.1 2-succinyl-5-enolpyruvyl-6-hydroxy-3-cyclohexene-1-carboxylic-acid synthase [Corynebacterium pseudotuberc
MISSPQLARAVAAKLAHYLTDVVICPGSRNSPLSLELLARDDIRVHTRIDERSAAFLALGMGRASGRHVGVLTTSGTAVANCLPAMVEAYHSHAPLAMISADRPAHLHGTGANQTINQTGIFGVVPTTSVAALADVELIDAAFNKGQVHINVELDTPLVEDCLPAPTTKGTKKAPIKGDFTDHGEVEIDLSRPTLVIAGDEAWDVPGLEDVPTIAEPSAPAPYHPVHPLATSIFAHEQVSAEGYVVNTKPEQVIVVGHPTLHRSVFDLIADPAIEVTVLTRTDTITDPTHSAQKVATRIKTTGRPSEQWLKICEAASELAAEAVRDVLAQDFRFSGLHVAAAVADTLATGDTLVLGASNPVRDASFVGLPFSAVDTYTPRGTAGIDGTVSQAIGVALTVQARNPEEIRAARTVALMGDVTFLHDVGGLFTGPDSPQPENLTIVVANDSGGGIFETLEVGSPQLRGSFERAFGTPHEIDIENIAAAYGVEYQLATDMQGLIEKLIDATDTAGFTLIEARTTRADRRAMHEALVKKVNM